jgi:hypothetical protein
MLKPNFTRLLRHKDHLHDTTETLPELFRKMTICSSSGYFQCHGFEKIEIEPTRIYRVEDAREFLSGQNIDVDAIAPQVDRKFMSAFVRAVKPREIRSHLTHIVTMFPNGEFSIPMFVHDQVPPGVPVMKEKCAEISYSYEGLPAGGRVRIRTTNPDALKAIHDFLRFQIEDHHTGDTTEATARYIRPKSSGLRKTGCGERRMKPVRI